MGNKGCVFKGPYLDERSPYWRMDIIRNGQRRWSSLHTKDEKKAKHRVDELRKREAVVE